MEAATLDRPQRTTAGLVPIFKLGPVDIDRRLLPYVRKDDTALTSMLDRHAAGDWGEFDPSREQLLPEDHPYRGRLLSLFMLNGFHIEVMTEWDCSATSVRFAH